MNYVKSFNLLGVDAQQIPCITGEGAPTTTTEGAVGCLYMDTTNGKLYKCTNVKSNVFTWVLVEGEKGADGITPHIGDNGNWYIGDTDTGLRAEALAEGATVVQTIGDSETAVMSQKAVSDEFTYLRKGKNTFTDIAQGTYNSAGFLDSTTRLRVNHFIPVKAGEKVKFTAGVKTVGVLVGFFNTARNYLRETSWCDTSTEIFVEQDGFVVVLFRNATNTEIISSDYDAVTELLSLDFQLQDELDARVAQIYNPKSVTPIPLTLNYTNEIGWCLTSSAHSRLIAIPIEPGKEYVLYQKIIDNTFFRIAFTNEPIEHGKITEYITFRDIVDGVFINNTINPYRFIAPEGYSYLVMNIWYATDPKYTLDDMLNSLYIFEADKIDAEKECAKNIEVEDTTFDGEIYTTIKEVQEKTTTKAFVFAFITDTHLRTEYPQIYNAAFDNAIKCLTEINKTLSLDAIIHGGDLVNGNNETFEAVLGHTNYGISKLLGVGAKNVLIAEGNHDGLFGNSADGYSRFTKGQIYSYFHRFNDVSVIRDINPSNYYKDFESHKLRLIIMGNAIAFENDTATWLSSVLESTPNEYKVIVFSHRLLRPASIDSPYASGYVNNEPFETVMQAHTDKIIGHFYGHVHWDNVTYVNGYAEIGTACSSPYRETEEPPEGATSVPTAYSGVGQQCFDIVCVLPDEGKFELVRFGGGVNRTVPFRQ